MTADEVANDIVDAALKVHRALGPGLLASAYQELHALFLACLALLAFRSSGGRSGKLLLPRRIGPGWHVLPESLELGQFSPLAADLT
jgi:hypothetical protein